MTTIDPPFMPTDEIREAACRLREKAFDDPAPAPVDLGELLYGYLYPEHDVEFYNDEPLGDEKRGDVLGKTLPLQNKIYVDCDLPDKHRGRYRFTVAHEIGHWALHRPLVLEQRLDDPDEAEFVTFRRDVFGDDETDDGTGENATGDDVDSDRPEETADESNAESYSAVEYQANVFAIWLLLPDAALRRKFGARFGDPPFPVDTDWDPNPDEDVLDTARALAATPKDGYESLENCFELSNTATAIALDERDYLSREA